MRIGICEDIDEDRKALGLLIESIKDKLSFQADVVYFSQGRRLLEAVRRGEKFELLLLDIYLEEVGGLEIARTARTSNPEVQVAFVTASEEYAVEAFELYALHYLVKPVTREGIETLFMRYFERCRFPAHSIEIRTERRSYRFPLHSIQKIQSSNKGVEVYLQGREKPQRIPTSFMNVEKQVDTAYFLKISRGLLVHMDFIDRMEQGCCHFRDGTSTLISRKERREIRHKYNDYLFRNLEGGKGAC